MIKKPSISIIFRLLTRVSGGGGSLKWGNKFEIKTKKWFLTDGFFSLDASKRSIKKPRFILQDVKKPRKRYRGLMCLAGGRASKGLPRSSPRPLTDKREAHMMGGVVILYNPWNNPSSLWRCDKVRVLINSSCLQLRF